MDFRILGSLEVGDEEGRKIALGAGRQRALLALLLLHAGEPVSTDRLIDELWGESVPPTAAKVVHNHVSGLRRALGDGRLVTRGHGYALELEPGELDLDRFEVLVADGARALAGGDARTASAKLHEALALWRGPPLADFTGEPFAQAPIARLEERRLAATEDRIEADLALGLHAELVGDLEELVRRNPLREHLYAQLMLALYRSGRQAEALASYRAARATLVEELGLEPGEELQELNRAVLAHDPQLAAPPRAALAVEAFAGIGGRVRPLRRRSRLLLAVAAVLFACGIAAGAEIMVGSVSRLIPITGNAVAVLDPGSGRVLDHVALAARPTAIGVGPNAVWVISADDGAAVRIDPETRRVVATVATRAIPSDIAVDAGAIWITDSSRAELIRIDPRTNAVVDRIDLARRGSRYPEGLSSVVTGEGAVWVGSGNGTVLKVDPQSDKLLDRIDVGTAPVDMALAGPNLWVVLVAGYVARIDTRSDRVTGIVPAAPYPRAIAAGNGSVWITSAPREGGGLLWRIDPGTVSVAGNTTTLDQAPAGIATGGGHVWIAGGPSGTLIKLDPSSRAITPIRLGPAPLDLVYHDGTLWVTVATQAIPPT